MPRLVSHTRCHARPARLLPALAMSIVLAAGLAMPAHAEPPILPDTPPALPAGMSEPANAALLYGRALRLIPAQTLEHMAETDNETGKPTARAIETLKANGETLVMARRATRIPRCDWGVEYQLGPYALMEHAGLMRRIVRALDNEAVILAEANIDRSIENVVAMLGIGEHMTQDRLVISTLVSAAITSLCNQRMSAFLDAGLIEPRHAEALLAAIDRVKATELFGAREALRTEQWMASEWFRAIGSGPDAGPRVAQMLTMLSDGEDEAILNAIALMNEAQLAPLFDKAALVYDEMLKALDKADPLPELTRINTAIEQGEYGLITLHFAAAILKIYEPTRRVTDELTKVQTRLKALQ